MQNKIVNKYLFKSYVGAVLFFALGGAATDMAVKEVKLAKQHADNARIVDDCSSTYMLCVLVIIASFGMAAFNGIYFPRKTHKKANQFAKLYLQNVFKEHPEMKQYESVLKNPKKLKEITAVICNGLTKEEQNLILDIVDVNASQTYPQVIEDSILNVVKKHAAKHPEYLQTIQNVLAGKSPYINIMLQSQKVR